MKRMQRYILSFSLPFLVLAVGAVGSVAAQTPEEAKQWEAQRSQAVAEAQAQALRVAQQRLARRADPMAWVRTLDPLASGGWEFRSVAADGSWANYSTEHQLKRSGHTMTVWIRQEFPEPQRAPSGDAFFSNVEKVQYDCAEDRSRVLTVIYYPANNLSGNQQTEDTDPKQTPWSAVVPGTQNETLMQWACRAPHLKN
jgi:Na+-transporting methylmalonyl-CoA/oxaloacetate decarboxylase gamma subunit